jgi:hypothetical protein
MNDPEIMHLFVLLVQPLSNLNPLARALFAKVMFHPCFGKMKPVD